MWEKMVGVYFKWSAKWYTSVVYITYSHTYSLMVGNSWYWVCITIGRRLPQNNMTVKNLSSIFLSNAECQN